MLRWGLGVAVSWGIGSSCLYYHELSRLDTLSAKERKDKETKGVPVGKQVRIQTEVLQMSQRQILKEW